ncbi:hypothetical protein ONZ45_g13920 [Pleurotus djamor]|nr:hypothetical protein ONZ45_g13920 [Pleurotus djamor]
MSPFDPTTESSSSTLTVHGDAGVDTAKTCEERSTMRLIDLRLVPILSLLFSVNTLDDANFGLAFVAGMDSDLQLTVGNRYSLVTSLYSFHYPIGLAALSAVGFISMAFGPILAFAWVRLDGARGIRGWSWIFIVEGALTAACGVLAFIIVPGFPQENTFLTTSQTNFALKRIDAVSVPDRITPKLIIHNLKDWVLWAHGFMFFCSLVPAIAMLFFMPVILSGMGWSGTRSLLMSAPPYLFASISALLIGWWSDKQQMRAPFIAGQGIMSLVGLLMTAFAQVIAVRYLGVFLLVAGSTGSIPSVMAYARHNLQHFLFVLLTPSYALSSIGGVATVNLFREKDAPHYLPGLCFAIGCQGLLLVLLLLTTIYYRRMNNSVRSGKVANIEASAVSAI